MLPLVEYWNPLVERCGLVLKDGSIIELPNTNPNPALHFSFSKDYFGSYSDCVATWHTHPDGNPNLSIADYESFLKYPNLFHYIVGDGIVWGYYIQENRVFLYEDDSISGATSGEIS